MGTKEWPRYPGGSSANYVPAATCAIRKGRALSRSTGCKGSVGRITKSDASINPTAEAAFEALVLGEVEKWRNSLVWPVKCVNLRRNISSEAAYWGFSGWGSESVENKQVRYLVVTP